ncbi:MAG: hypothetical protein F4Z40_02385, partial [Chloroflexi bacterium]|nr:hypothetical protein [Chloroflexota bacterium]
MSPMQRQSIMKFNPGFLADDQIIETFCVNTAEFDSIVESLLESEGGSNPHSLVIGSRGAGKTHLLLRVAAEVRRNVALSRWFPIVFSEESYEVSTCGEFWLECLKRLAQQVPESQRPDLELTLGEVRAEQVDERLKERCLGALLDFSDRNNQRLLLIVENLNSLFAELVDQDAGWKLRKTLQTEPRFMLLASSTSRFDEIDNPELALYDLFRIKMLRPLQTDECLTLWTAVSGQIAQKQAVRPLQILTGGNPRLLVIIAQFGSNRSLRDLMTNLLALIDEHTEYFRGHLESLPVLERRIYLVLARLWNPATAKEIADEARTDTSKCSALLSRLVKRGRVSISGGTRRRREYWLTERLYNIYYLLRCGAGPSRLIECLIEFMVSLYAPKDLAEVLDRMGREIKSSDPISVGTESDWANALTHRVYAAVDEGNLEEAFSILGPAIESSGTQVIDSIDLHFTAAFLRETSQLFESEEFSKCLPICDLWLGKIAKLPNFPLH